MNETEEDEEEEQSNFTSAADSKRTEQNVSMGSDVSMRSTREISLETKSDISMRSDHSNKCAKILKTTKKKGLQPIDSKQDDELKLGMFYLIVNLKLNLNEMNSYFIIDCSNTPKIVAIRKGLRSKEKRQTKRLQRSVKTTKVEIKRTVNPVRKCQQ